MTKVITCTISPTFIWRPSRAIVLRLLLCRPCEDRANVPKRLQREEQWQSGVITFDQELDKRMSLAHTSPSQSKCACGCGVCARVDGRAPDTVTSKAEDFEYRFSSTEC